MTPLFIDIITLCWAVFFLVWVVSAFSAKRTLKRDRSWVWVRVAFVVIFIAVVTTSPDLQYAPPLWLGWLGAALCACGVALCVWARFYLGRNWGMPMSVKENPELVTTGPYTYIRHPIYSGALLAMLGTALAVGSIYWWLVLIVMGGSFLWSASQEDKTLESTFQGSYAEYKKHSKMLIPFIF